MTYKINIVQSIYFFLSSIGVFLVTVSASAEQKIYYGDGGGFGIDQETVIINQREASGADLKLQFGTNVNRNILWDDSGGYFSISNDLSFVGKQLIDFRMENASSDPTCDGTRNGRMYHNTLSDLSYVCDGVGWKLLDSAWTINGTSDAIYSGGGVGIGIDPPVSIGHVYENTTNVDSSAGLTLEQDSTGDAIAQFLLTGVQRWVAGIDNSDLDKFKIASSADLNTNARLTIDTSGNVGIGNTSPTDPITVNGVAALGETGVPTSTSNYGKLYVKSSASDLYFMDDGGTEYQLTATRDLFYAYDAGGAIALNAVGGWTDINLDSEPIEDPSYTHAADSAEITINTDGWYEVTYYFAAALTAGTRWESTVKLQEDTGSGYGDIPGTIGKAYNRASAPGNTASTTILRQFTDGDKIKMVAQVNGNGASTTANGCGITIKTATAVGSAGGGGGGSAEWTLTSGAVHPNSSATDMVVGGTTLASSVFSVDESLGVFLFGGDQSQNPTLRFEATDSDTADFGFNANDAFYFSGGNVGFGGVTAPTAFGDFAAATTSQASLRVQTGATPSVPNTGDLYSDGTDLFFYNGSGWDDLTTTGTAQWTLGGGAVYPVLGTTDLVVGGTSIASSVFSVDESTGVALFGGDQSQNPTLRFEATDSDTADFGFNTNDSFYFTGGDVGIGVTNPGAFLDLAASTTSKASMRLQTGATPTTPAAGDLYSDGTNILFYNGSGWDDLTAGAGGSEWTTGGGAVSPTLAITDLAIGGTTLASSMFSIDESTGTFLLGGDQSANPTFTFEATDSDTADFGFNTNDSFYFSGGNVGFGVTDPAAFAEFGASTTSLASARFRTGVTPTSPSAGDMYSDGTNILFYNGSSWDDLTAGAGASEWTTGGGVVSPTLATTDLAIGGTTLEASIFSIDESTGTFLFGGDQSQNPKLTFEAIDSDTGDFGFNQTDAFYFTGAELGVGNADPKALFHVSGTGTIAKFGDGTANDIAIAFDDGADRTITWNDTDGRFDIGEAVQISGNTDMVGIASLAGDHSVADSDGTLNLGRNASVWETLTFDATTDNRFELSDALDVGGTLSATNIIGNGDLITGGGTLAASMFSVDESTGTFLLGGDQSANPTLTFEATDNDTADFGFNTNDSFYFSGGNVGIGVTNPAEELSVNGVLALGEGTAPGSTSGYGKVYVKSSDSELYYQDDGGTETGLTNTKKWRLLKSGTQATTGTYADITGWATAEIEDGAYSFNTSTGVMTFQEDGWYQIFYDVICDNGTSRTQLDIILQENTGGGYANITGSQFSNYAIRNTTQLRGGTSGMILRQFNSTDLLKIQTRVIGAACNILTDDARITILKT